jgi:Ca2+-binding RTX toxin-like protein
MIYNIIKGNASNNRLTSDIDTLNPDDEILGFAGNDKLFGLTGDNLLFGGDGNDSKGQRNHHRPNQQ